MILEPVRYRTDENGNTVLRPVSREALDLTARTRPNNTTGKKLFTDDIGYWHWTRFVVGSQMELDTLEERMRNHMRFVGWRSRRFGRNTNSFGGKTPFASNVHMISGQDPRDGLFKLDIFYTILKPNAKR